MTDNPFLSAIVEKLSELTALEPEELRSMVQRPANPEFGDFAFPCFVLARTAKKNPAQVAVELAGRFEAPGMIERAEAKGPYLNFRVNQAGYMEHVLRRVHEESEGYGDSCSGRGKTVVVDYSSPNIAKPLGVHHLCSTMTGHSLCRIYEALGYKVVRINHLGDWGTQFGVLLAAYELWGKDIAEPGIHELVDLYVRYSRAMQDDEGLAARAREWFGRLEQGDNAALERWEKFRDVSLSEFRRVYERLKVHFDSYAGESFYNEYIDQIVDRLDDAGLTKLSQDALVVDLEAYNMPPCILKKSDDASLYATRDLAAVDYRMKTYHFDKALYVVGADQRLHFNQVFKVLELWGHEAAGKCVHVDFGLVKFGGVKGATRAGNIELLDDVLDAAVNLAKETIRENEKKIRFESNADEIAEMVGLAAVVFSILGKARRKDVEFDWDQILSFRGNTGPYLQYAHARQASILRKYGKPVTPDVNYARLNDPEERHLARLLHEFPEAVERAANEYEPSVVCNYLIELAAAYSRYSQDSVRHKVLSSDEQLTDARALLVSCVRTVIAKGLYLVGIAAPQQM